jgi:Fe-S cluster assembly protein SufD
MIEGENQLICPRIEYFFGALSQAEVVTTVVHGNSAGNFISAVTNFALEDGAQIGFSRTLFDTKGNGWHFDATRAVLKKDSAFTSVIAENGGECYRDDYKVALVGSNADVHLNGVSMLDGKYQSHTHVLVDHQAPECRSLQVFKNALNGFSKSSFEGKIYVHKIAQKTQAFQLNNNLILNEGAVCNSKPNLEIFADDVKASHGATFGSLDQEQLFYFLTRGISEKTAKNMLVQGFCIEIIEKFKVPSLLSSAKEWTKNYG